MTSADFRRLALSLEGAEEGSHMGSPDFRVGGRIFATLAAEKQGYGNLMLSPELQADFVAEEPDVFIAVKGGWGKNGATHVVLAKSNEDLLLGALRAAWRLRLEKNAKVTRPRTAAATKIEQRNTMRKTASPQTIDNYIDRFQPEVQERLAEMRATIHKAAPGATETISYGIPSFRMARPLVWFAAFKNHIGFYPGASAIAAFKKELAAFKAAKGSVQFPFDEPLPLALVSRIVKFRMKEEAAKMKAQAAKKAALKN